MVAPSASTGYVPPPYPHDRLGDLVRVARDHAGGFVDCSIAFLEEWPVTSGQAERDSALRFAFCLENDCAAAVAAQLSAQTRADTVRRIDDAQLCRV